MAPTGPEQPGCYVYGIVPADVEPAGDVRGVGDPPARVELVRYGSLAALVSEVDLTGSLGTPADLRAHAQILDATAVEVPVLPLRFGTVMATKDAVAGDLLAAYQDAFTAALADVEGRAQYVVKGRYVEQAVLAEVLTEIPEAARLGKLIRGQDPDATRQPSANPSSSAMTTAKPACFDPGSPIRPLSNSSVTRPCKPPRRGRSPPTSGYSQPASRPAPGRSGSPGTCPARARAAGSRDGTGMDRPSTPSGRTSPCGACGCTTPRPRRQRSSTSPNGPTRASCPPPGTAEPAAATKTPRHSNPCRTRPIRSKDPRR